MVSTVKHGGGSVIMWGCIYLIVSWTQQCTALYWRRRCCHHFSNTTMIQKHTSKATVTFLKQNRVKVIEWPSLSPDLNPIEHLLGIVKLQVQNHSPSSIQAVKEVILEEWKKKDFALCRQLVHSMPRRLDAVLKSNGAHTKCVEEQRLYSALSLRERQATLRRKLISPFVF